MDTLAHGLWATAAVKANNTFSSIKVHSRWFIFWGVLPDLLSFTPVVVWLLWQVIIVGTPFSDVPRPELLPPEVRKTIPVFRLINGLYYLSHSLIVFAGIFILAWLICCCFFNPKHILQIRNTGTHLFRPPWELIGWMLHILIDIPTHTRGLYPTPFLWPLSNVTVDGISWGKPWFMAMNYSSLLLVFLLLRIKSKNMKGR